MRLEARQSGATDLGGGRPDRSSGLSGECIRGGGVDARRIARAHVKTHASPALRAPSLVHADPKPQEFRVRGRDLFGGLTHEREIAAAA